MAIDWKAYQEEAASFFRSIGLNAETDVAVQGVRTSHDVDVLVKSVHAGFHVTWIVECKHWKTRVSKLHVLALREIVAEVGADRGILLSEEGFQSGAVEAATLTNVQVTSLAHLTASATNNIFLMRLHDLFDRVEDCNKRYWDIPKHERIEHELRPESGGYGYSAAVKIDLARDLLSRAFHGRYPFKSEVIGAFAESGVPEQFSSIQEVLTIVDPIVCELEGRLSAYDMARRTT